MSSAVSVKDRLKNKSRSTGKTMQELLTAYGLERTIYRLSKSRYKEHFILKGGIFLYALYDGSYVRATTDIDFLAQRISNYTEDIKQVFSAIFSIETDDPLRFEINSLNVKPIAEMKKYHGVNVSVIAYLDRTSINVSIDIGFGDVIVPNKVEMDFPVVLSDESPQVYAYSLCSTIAEKFEAIVSLAYDNTRFKDYYDIYVLSTTQDFDGKELMEAIMETFENRHTSLTEIVAFEEGFAVEPLRQTRWKAFVKKKKAMLPVSLEDTISGIQQFIQPVVDAVINNEKFDRKWSHEQKKWSK
ncbi:nucleotidyl transferase AbiEii/AbiGii toxin family protein [Ruminococcus albus]|uniref:Predicted nucleotidyltransferase component of viral defense system n=1 Tax=Ruminococcus albus TaxID=1264 RepID=A0A1I1R7N8_RUMAL|nr:nucleotidyl transferase AbiEii/AbiGii toxin family protein [Ruminococcus albus]SFD30329.1 Predicted nucleotidyltransferase component of viral defense system [Ruminococcus albus]